MRSTDFNYHSLISFNRAQMCKEKNANFFQENEHNMAYIHKAHAFWQYLFHSTTICAYGLVNVGVNSQKEVMVDFCAIHSSACLE